MSYSLNFKNTISWLLGLIFLVLSILNLAMVHPIPGAFYLILSFIYYPPANAMVKQRLGFTIPFAVKIFLALVVIWGTLAVGDLAEMYGL